jgi:hypothetical protein
MSNHSFGSSEMRRHCVWTAIVVAVLGCSARGWAQPWIFDFGTATGAFTTANTVDTSTFLPVPEVSAGKARVRVGTQGGGFFLENQVIGFGSESYLRIAAPTGSSLNKMSVYNYSPGNAFTFRFHVRFGASDGSPSATAGSWYMFAGDSGCFTSNSGFTGTHCFLGMRWLFYAGGRVSTRYRNTGSWSSAGLDTASFAQGHEYLVEIYGNNSPVDLPYTFNGPQSIPSNSFDIWVDNVLVGDALPKAQIGNLANIDSWMFYAENSAGSAANLFLDNITYTNGVAESRLPIKLASFRATAFGANSVVITWKTISEVDNYGFKVEKSSNGTDFSEIQGSFTAGNGTTNRSFDYSYTDNGVRSGTWYYRLLQMDLDGSVHYGGTMKVEVLTGIADTSPAIFLLEQNWPNPFNPKTVVSCQLPVPSKVRLVVYDMLGREVATLLDEVMEAGRYDVPFEGAGLSSGVYVYRLTAGRYVESKRMVLAR